ncbi:MAG: hypothetical protein JWR15_538 [Prosthecobacter sp.]|nr:hypothetical protein [Prosthecobacter sp.]
MKQTVLKTLAAMALFTASASAANVTINLTGSTAFRAATNAAILASLGSPTYAYNEATAGDGFNKCTYAIIKGTHNGNNITVRVFWAGSVEGVQYPSTGVSLAKFIPTTQATSGGGTNLGNVTFSDPGVVDAGMSDVFKSSAGFPDADLQDTQVGVVPFVFVTHPNAPFSNMNSQLMKVVYGQDYAFLSNFIAGGSSTVSVYGCGRNSDSGTRVTTLAETGYGYTNSVYQYTATVNGTTTLSFAQNSPANNGASSGGTLAKSLAKPSSDTVGWGVGYIGVGDLQGTNLTMTYNGQAYSPANIKNGSYTLWGYEHCFVAARVRDAGTGTDDEARKNWINSMTGLLIADPSASAGIKLSDMTVTRPGDGAAITNNF